MKHLLFFSFFSLLITSCASTYKYVSVESHELSRNEQQEFTHETDSLNVTFGFEGNGIPLHLNIQNKTQNPLYIDWSRSALIVEGKRFSFYKNEGTIDLNGTSTSTNRDNDINNIDLKGNVAFREALSFIPPQSYEIRTPVLLHDKLNLAMYNVTSKTLEYWNGIKDAYVTNYDDEYRPPEFRVYLTMSFDSKFETSFALDQTFHVDEIMETKLAPDYRKDKLKHQGFIVSSSSNTGAAVGILILGTLAVLLIISDLN